MTIFSGVRNAILYFIETILVYISPEKFSCFFFNKGRNRWLICARLGINLTMQCTEPRRDRNFYNNFDASRVKIAEVLLSSGEIPDCEI